MKQKGGSKNGFTLIETTLVLAISVAVLMAFVVTISTRVGRERYKDATNSFADFLRRIYSETINVENTRSGSIDDQNNFCTLAGQYQAAKGEQSKNPDSDGYPGRSGCAIYGKLITFGENYGTSDEDKRIIYVYDLVGRAIDITHPLSFSASSSITDQLAAINADVLVLKKNDNNSLCSVKPVATVQKFDPAWSSTIETTARDTMYKGAMLIVRSPSSGAVHTYALDEGTELELQRIISENHSDLACDSAETVTNSVNGMKSNINQYLKDGAFKEREQNFCIGSGESFMALPTIKRNNIRVKADGHNGTAVEFIETNLAKSEGGNACD